MIEKLIRWAVQNRLIVVLLAFALLGYGLYAFNNINVEAYPDPAPAIVEIVARYPGASAEEVERQVTIPLEVALAGMPGLKYTQTQSMFELCHIRNQFEYGVDQPAARQEILNRLQMAQLPAGITPAISPQSPTGEIFRYVLTNPKDAAGHDIYNLNDLKSLQDYHAGAVVPPPAGRGRRLQLRRHGQTLRDPSRPGPHAALRHHAAADQGRGFRQQLECGRRIRHRGRYGPRGPLSGTDRLRPGPDRNRHGHEGSGRRPRLSPQRRRAPAPGNPPDRADRHEQRARPRRRRRRRRTAARGRCGRSPRRGRRLANPPRSRRAELSAPGCAGKRSPRRPGPTRLARRRRRGAVHLLAAQRGPVAAGARGSESPGQAIERVAGPPAAGREDHALLRPHRPDPRHDRHRAGKPAGRHGAGDAGVVHVPHATCAAS